jgi:hypothetical protein
MYLEKQVDFSVPCRIKIEIKLFARADQEWARRDSTDIVLPTLTVIHILMCIVMCIVMPHTWRGVVWNLEKGEQCTI